MSFYDDDSRGRLYDPMRAVDGRILDANIFSPESNTTASANPQANHAVGEFEERRVASRPGDAGNAWISDASGLAEDSIGSVYLATPLGVQVCEASGRVPEFLNLPEHEGASCLVFAGPSKSPAQPAFPRSRRNLRCESECICNDIGVGNRQRFAVRYMESAVPGWRNGIRRGLKILRGSRLVWVRPPPRAPIFA
jgi:hypothetical protein